MEAEEGGIKECPILVLVYRTLLLEIFCHAFCIYDMVVRVLNSRDCPGW